MRRGLSIFFILFLGLAPLATALPAREDLSLPPCCRRHGAHHCAMRARMMEMQARTASGKPSFTAPSTCPFYPGYILATTTVVHALAAALVSLPVPQTQLHAPTIHSASALLNPIRARAGRGPPANSLG